MSLREVSVVKISRNVTLANKMKNNMKPVKQFDSRNNFLPAIS